MTDAAPPPETPAATRQLLPDLVRAFALFGICVVNVGVMAWPMASMYHYPGGLTGPLDEAAFFAISALFLFKSYSLFSLMFGVSFAYQMESAARRGVGFAGRYWRRIVGLLAFGILNIVCLFVGDILVMYAMLGSFLFLFRKAGAKTLTIWGVTIYVLQTLFVALLAGLMWLGMTYDPEGMAEEMAVMQDMDAAAIAAFQSPSFIEAAIYRIQTYITDGIFMIMIQGGAAFAFFLFGFALMRTGAIADPAARIWKRSRVFLLPVGLIISSWGGWIMLKSTGMADPAAMWGMTLILVGSPFSTMGYIGLIAKWAEGSGGPMRAVLARGGTASLTAYLMQGLLLSLVFSGYGLGLFAKVPAAPSVAIGTAIALFTIAFASIWRRYHPRGPLEMVLRNWTYLGER